MKPESNITTLPPVSELPLPISLPGSELMNFTINGEEWLFTLTLDGQGHLVSLIATKDGVTCDCTIQLVAQNNGTRTCCGPAGCTAGSC
jgi:hypothetical protein